MRITVVTPTRGDRDSINSTIATVASLLLPGDEHLLIHDAPPDAPILKYESSLFTSLHRHHVVGSVYGNAQRDYAASIAKGDCLVYIDDDDWPGPDAFRVLHATEADPNKVHFFRMQNHGFTFPSDRPIVGTMGGPQCVPPVRTDLPRWAQHNVYEADGHFLMECARRYEKVFHSEVICFIRPLGWKK